MEVLLILIVVVIFYRLNAPKWKGAKGERRVARKLKRLGSKEFKVFNNVIINTSKGSSQIDHVVVSVYGIFVIETKNYTGWIHGSEHSEYWTQTIFKTRNKFRNPIKQNWAHIYALKEILHDFEQVLYHPIVVFAGDGELRNVYSEIPVIYSWHLIRTIKDIRREPTLLIEQVDTIVDRIYENSKQGKVEVRAHKQQVKQHVVERKRMESNLVCPKCREELVIRKGKYGKFYGGPSYPKCRYTHKY